MIFKVSLLLYAVGSNIHGQLGLGDNTFRQVFAKVNGFIDSQIKQVVSGPNFTLFLDKKNHVYGSGDNSVCQLGLNNSIKSVSAPIIIDFFAKKNIQIEQIAAGYNHSLALTSDGKNLYSFGDNSQGQLGRVTNSDNDTIFEVVDITNLAPDEKIVYITSQAYYNYLKTDKGNWYAWGYDNCNYLFQNLTSCTKLLIPTKMKMPLNVKTIHLGQFNIWVINQNKTLYGMGSNQYGSLCFGKLKRPESIFYEMAQNVEKVVTGSYHMIYLSNSQVYGCGIGNSGQLGNKTIEQSGNIHLQISEGLNGVYDIAATANGTHLISQLGLMATGINDFGELSVNSTTTQFSFTPVIYPPQIQPIKYISNGFNHLFLLTVNEQEETENEEESKPKPVPEEEENKPVPKPEEEEEHKNPSNKLSGGTIALIVIGVLIIVLLITVIVLLVLKQVKCKESDQKRWLLQENE